MKKVLVTVAMILGVSTFATFAQEVTPPVTENATEATAPQDEFVKMDPSALPQSLVEKLAVTNEGASVKEAYVKETEGKKIYKLVLVTTDEQELTVILDENGEPVKE